MRMLFEELQNTNPAMQARFPSLSLDQKLLGSFMPISRFRCRPFSVRLDDLRDLVGKFLRIPG